MMVCFEITTAQGQVFSGGVQGNGGTIGAGAAQPEGRARLACKSLNLAINEINHGRDIQIDDLSSRSLGHCLMVKEIDEQSVFTEVPLKGASYRLLHDGVYGLDKRINTEKGQGIITEIELVNNKPTGNYAVRLNGATETEMYSRDQFLAS